MSIVNLLVKIHAGGYVLQQSGCSFVGKWWGTEHYYLLVCLHILCMHTLPQYLSLFVCSGYHCSSLINVLSWEPVEHTQVNMHPCVAAVVVWSYPLSWYTLAWTTIPHLSTNTQANCHFPLSQLLRLASISEATSGLAKADHHLVALSLKMAVWLSVARPMFIRRCQMGIYRS